MQPCRTRRRQRQQAAAAERAAAGGGGIRRRAAAAGAGAGGVLLLLVVVAVSSLAAAATAFLIPSSPFQPGGGGGVAASQGRRRRHGLTMSSSVAGTSSSDAAAAATSTGTGTSTSSSSSHLSILELLKATIGLQSGPWSLPISNSSVVRLSTAREIWNETEPWRRYPVGFKRPTSTAFVADVNKRYLVTADHVLASHFRITASRPGLPEGEEHRARVLCRAGEWDLALLTVDDDAFWEGIEAVPLNAGVTCRPESLVTVAGYYNRSLTTDEWMVQGYSMGPSCVNLDLYRSGQTTWGGGSKEEGGPVMPFGCSGGPVLAQTKGMGWSVVGMLSAGQPDRALLHTVPAHLIQRMIAQYEASGEFSGGSTAPFKYQRLTNPFLRERLEMSAASSGVLVTEVASWPPAEESPLRANDVLMEVDGLAVDDSGVVALPPYRLQVDVRGLWDVKAAGEELSYKVLREGRVVNLKGKTHHCGPVVPISASATSPPRDYVLVGGLLFLPASQAKVMMCQDRVNNAPVETQVLLKAEPRIFPDEEYVLLWRIYPHEVNEGYEERLSRLVSFNGQRVRNLAQLEDLIKLARPEHEDASWLEFEMADAEQRRIVLPAYQAWASEAAIRKTNRIPYSRPRLTPEEKAALDAQEGSGDESEDEDEDEDDDDETIVL